nr:MTAP family purine nucleoside phosphorylase [Anaerolineae bacterium]
MTDPIARIAVIGGSGLYNMPELTDKETHDLETPFGKPSAPIVVGTLRGQRVAFLARHGLGHHLTPSEVPYRANLYALKMLGVRFILAANACGSLREEYAPGHLVLPTQLYDNTKSERGGRSFFGGGIVGHVGVA